MIESHAQEIGNDCLFCTISKERSFLESDLFYVMYDQFPVTDKHCLIIPKRHCETIFDLTPEEIQASFNLIHQLKRTIEAKDKAVTGFNIGMNAGEAAGQTVMHCHIHLIPRRKGDTPNPRGGVRGVIPGKQSY